MTVLELQAFLNTCKPDAYVTVMDRSGLTVVVSRALRVVAVHNGVLRRNAEPLPAGTPVVELS